MAKYRTAIEKIIVADATFRDSLAREFSPSWINFFYGNNGTGKSTILLLRQQRHRQVHDMMVPSATKFITSMNCAAT